MSANGSENKFLAQIQLYSKMVRQTAIRSWYLLAPHTRVWIERDDLIQQGMNWLVTIGLPKVEADRSENEKSRFIHLGLINHFDSTVVGKFAYRKRNEGRVFGFCDMGQQAMAGWKDSWTGTGILRDHFVVPLATHIYSQASPRLQSELIYWLSPGVKPRTDGNRFTMARDEFLGLAKQHGMGYDDFKHLLTSDTCRDAFLRSVSL